MAGTGLCCGSLEEPKALMKMGLCLVFVGHVNFLLGALVHGVVLRHISLSNHNTAVEVVISNVVALVTGLIGTVVGILAIILSKNKKSRGLTWSLFSVSLGAAVMAAASAIGLFVSVVIAIVQNGRSLLAYCRFPDAIGYSAVNNECPFDPTRVNSTTLLLWVPLVVTCVIQMVFSARCFAVCLSFLGVSCCPNRKRHKNCSTAINVMRPMEAVVASSYIEPPRYTEHLTRCAEPPRSHHEPPRCNSAPSGQQRHPPPLPQHPPRHPRSLPPSEKQPLRQPYRERSHRQRQQTSTGGQQRALEQHYLLDRGTMERSSFWI